jgi:GT2 family glycosyltransferase
MNSKLQSSSSIIPVIVVNWNGKKFLPECLESITKQTYKSNHVIMVDNGSTDGSVDFVKKNFPNIKTISLNNNYGFAEGNNIALRNIHSRYVALLNNDAVAEPNWLYSLVNGLEKYPQAGFAASKMLNYNNQEIIDRAGDTYTTCGAANLRGRGEPRDNYSEQQWIFGACGAAVLYRTEMLKDIGFFDENYFLIYEDVDLSFRAQLKGYKCLYVPEAIVYHKGSSSIQTDSPTSVYYGHRNLEWTYFKNMPVNLLQKTILLHLFYNLFALLYFIITGKGRYFIKAKVHAIMKFNKILLERKKIQKTKKVDDNYLWNLFEQEIFLPRLLKRFRKF